MKSWLGFTLALLFAGCLYGVVGDVPSEVSSPKVTAKDFVWSVGEPVDVYFGPSDAIYCRVQDNYGHIIYDNFGECNIALSRVTVAHRGTWRIFLGLPGYVKLEEFTFHVEVLERGNKPVVISSVVTEKPAVTLSCSVPTQHKVRACKFRDPQNRTLVASHETGVGAYTFNGQEVNYESSADNHSCTLVLKDPSVLDFGIWRCGLDTSTGTYYGFFTVVCPEAIQQPEIAAIVNTDAVLHAESETFEYLDDEPVVMKCFVPAHVQYCYFRAMNGSIYNVFPGMSTSGNFEYVGSGLDAGECGIRFNRLSPSESGIWSCHVGLDNSTVEEQRESFFVQVEAQMGVDLWHVDDRSIVVGAFITFPYTIDYCRFVMMNGVGFTFNNLPSGYSIYRNTTSTCSIRRLNPSVIELHPWTVAVKIRGQDGEISKSTRNLFEMPTSPGYTGPSAFFWLFIALICLLPLLAGFMFVKRKIISKRASRVRTSFRDSWQNTFQKKPPATPVVQNRV